MSILIILGEETTSTTVQEGEQTWTPSERPTTWTPEEVND